MDSLLLQGKWRLRAHGRSLVLAKRAGEKPSHVWLKGLLWALYLPHYPNILVEVALGHRYKPDLVSFAQDYQRCPQARPVFWAEAGQVTLDKLASLVRQFPDTHFAVAKWGPLGNWENHLEQLLQSSRLRNRFDLLNFQGESPLQYLDPKGSIAVSLDQVLVKRWGTP